MPAIRGIDLCVNRGEFVIIVGKSGSGKSSLLNILGTVDSPTRGEMTIGGYEFNEKVDDKAVSEIRLHALGFIFQTFNLIPGMTAAENVELPLILLVGLRGSVERRASCRGRSANRRWRNCYSAWAWRTAATTTPHSSAEESSSESRLPEDSRTRAVGGAREWVVRTCCCWTSRRATWTR